MKRLTNFFFLILLFSLSCKETNNGIQEDKTVSKDIRYNEVNFDLIHKIKYYEAVEKWINYSELSEFIVQINSADYSSLIDNKKFLLKKIDLLGREAINKGFQLFIYDDGSVEKKFVVD